MTARATLRYVVSALAAPLVLVALLTPRTALAAGAADAPPAIRAQMLVDTAWLEARLDDPGLVVLHVGKSRDLYDHAHVPGARFAAFGEVATARGTVPNEMPSVEELTALVRHFGLAGRAALLDGQWAAWQAEGRPVTAEVPAVVASSVVPRARPERIASLAEVDALSRQLTASPDARVALVDARPREQFEGAEAGEGVSRPGHVPGAVSAFWKDDLQAGDVPRLRSADELRARYVALGVAPDDVVVAYCRTGVQASYTYFVLAYLGYDVRLYDGSFAEWSAAPGTSVARR